MHRLILLGIFTLYLLFGIEANAQPNAPRLEIKSIVLGAGVKIDFSVTSVDRESRNASSLVGQTSSYKIYVNPSICEYNSRLRFFTYELYVRKINPEQWFCYALREMTFGQFNDHFKDVTFSIDEETRLLHLPLHSLSSEHYIEPLFIQTQSEKTLKEAVCNVRLGIAQKLPLRLRNKLQDMQIQVLSVKLTYLQPDLWSYPVADVNNLPN